MTKRIFRSICLVAITVFLASLVLIMGLLYNYFSKAQQHQLKSQTALAAQGAASAGASYFDGLDTGDYRITWIAADGTVLYDSASASGTMENHLDREEVKEALSTGWGESSRYSDTLTERLYYAAQRLPDGTVIRMSGAQYTVWVLLMGAMQPVAAVALIAVLLSFLLAYRLSKRIIHPLNDLDLDHPDDISVYEEMRPVLNRLAAQQQELRRDKDELEKNESIRREFTANVSHELKTPLQSISGYAELLQAGMVKPEDIRPFAGKIHEESQRLTRLVEDIISLSHLDNGAVDMAFEETDLYDIVHHAADSLQPVADASDITLTVTGLPSPMTGIPQLLYSLVYNLCDNAIKYNRPKGSVSVEVHPQNTDILLTVSDTGIGIPEADRDRIFERFYRVDKSRSREVGGTGLGLSIVKHAILIHRGDIRVESTPEGGTVFTVRLPCSPKESLMP